MTEHTAAEGRSGDSGPPSTCRHSFRAKRLNHWQYLSARCGRKRTCCGITFSGPSLIDGHPALTKALPRERCASERCTRRKSTALSGLRRCGAAEILKLGPRAPIDTVMGEGQSTDSDSAGAAGMDGPALRRPEECSADPRGPRRRRHRHSSPNADAAAHGCGMDGGRRGPSTRSWTSADGQAERLEPAPRGAEHVPGGAGPRSASCAAQAQHRRRGTGAPARRPVATLMPRGVGRLASRSRACPPVRRGAGDGGYRRTSKARADAVVRGGRRAAAGGRVGPREGRCLTWRCCRSRAGWSRPPDAGRYATDGGAAHAVYHRETTAVVGPLVARRVEMLNWAEMPRRGQGPLGAARRVKMSVPARERSRPTWLLPHTPPPPGSRARREKALELLRR